MMIQKQTTAPGLGVHRIIPGLLAPHPHCETIHRRLDVGRRRRRQMEVVAGKSAGSICHRRHESERREVETESMTGKTVCLTPVGRREQGVRRCHVGAASSVWHQTCRCSVDAQGVDDPRIGQDTLVCYGKTDSRLSRQSVIR